MSYTRASTKEESVGDRKRESEHQRYLVRAPNTKKNRVSMMPREKGQLRPLVTIQSEPEYDCDATAVFTPLSPHQLERM
jgi:hypothetical protein